MVNYEVLVRVNAEPNVWNRTMSFLKTASSITCSQPADSTVVYPGSLLNSQIMILALHGNYLAGFVLASCIESDEILFAQTVSSRSVSKGLHEMLEIVARAAGFKFLQMRALPHAVSEYISYGFEGILGEIPPEVTRLVKDYETSLIKLQQKDRINKLAEFLREMIAAGFSTKTTENSLIKKINGLGVILRKSLKGYLRLKNDEEERGPMWDMARELRFLDDTHLQTKPEEHENRTDSAPPPEPVHSNSDKRAQFSGEPLRQAQFSGEPLLDAQFSGETLLDAAEERSSTSSYEALNLERQSNEGEGSYREVDYAQNIETFFGINNSGTTMNSGSPFL